MAAAHGAEVVLALLRADGRAGELAVGQVDPVAAARVEHLPQRLGADLVAEAARAAVDRDDDVARAQAEGLGRLRVVDLRHLLHLEVVVAGAERADLVAHARLGARLETHSGRASRIAPPSSMRSRSPRSPQPRSTAQRAPPRSMRSISSAESRIRPRLPTPAGIARKSASASVLLPRLDVRAGEARAQAAHAAGDVEAHAPRGDDTLVGIEGGDAAHREAVAPVRVGHGHRGGADAGQAWPRSRPARRPCGPSRAPAARSRRGGRARASSRAARSPTRTRTGASAERGPRLVLRSHVHHALGHPAAAPRARPAGRSRSRPSPRPPAGAAPPRPARRRRGPRGSGRPRFTS